ncbi:antibiotic biosynthesis monooxygenase family protein [Paenibacillus harenae]|uniref:antibiotic biosynthesis monooxygenase family protein n=1 Tax=Paenibacillus harenae TaxID=306543 RepID=UPI0003FF837C|nr:antibiotic biosynthesis monooxygenase [Paenibacillus harenae]
MFIETKIFIVKKGTAGLVVEHFTPPGEIEKSPGFIDLSVMQKKTSRSGDEEVLVLIRWESEAAWKRWETSEPHLEGHRQARGKSEPEHIVGFEHGYYKVLAAKKAETI